MAWRLNPRHPPILFTAQNRQLMGQLTKVHKAVLSTNRAKIEHRKHHPKPKLNLTSNEYDPINGSQNDCLIAFLVCGLAFLSFGAGVAQILLA